MSHTAKRIAAGLLCLAMVMGMAACGSEKDQRPEEQDAAPTASPDDSGNDDGCLTDALFW